MQSGVCFNFNGIIKHILWKWKARREEEWGLFVTPRYDYKSHCCCGGELLGKVIVWRQSHRTDLTSVCLINTSFTDFMCACGKARWEGQRECVRESEGDRGMSGRQFAGSRGILSLHWSHLRTLMHSEVSCTHCSTKSPEHIKSNRRGIFLLHEVASQHLGRSCICEILCSTV